LGFKFIPFISKKQNPVPLTLPLATPVIEERKKERGKVKLETTRKRDGGKQRVEKDLAQSF
jgi:hypothetical protein